MIVFEKILPIKFSFLKRCYKQLVLLTLCLLFVQISQSQPKSRIRFRNIELAKSWSHSRIFSIYQSSQGYLWVGTFDGLNRYDGYTVTKYTIGDDNKSIAGHSIRCIMEDKNGVMWVGTNNGLSKYMPETDNFISYRLPKDKWELSTSPLPYIWNILEDSDNNLWIASMKGLYIFDRKKEQFREIDLKGEFHCLYEDHLKNIWAGTSVGIRSFAPKTFQKKDYNNQFDDSVFTQDINSIIQENRTNQLWILAKRGLAKYSYETNSFDLNYFYVNHRLGSPYDTTFVYLETITQDKIGRIWIGTGLGLTIYNNNSSYLDWYLHNDADPTSVSYSEINCLYTDKAGLVWIGTENGLSMYDPYYQQFQHFFKTTTAPSSFRFESPFVISKQPSNIELISSRLYPRKYSSAELSSKKISRIFIDSKNRLWIGTSDNGVNLYHQNTGTYTVFQAIPKDDKSLNSNIIYTFYEDSNNNIWVGDKFGLNLYNEKDSSFTSFNQTKSGSNKVDVNSVTDIVEYKKNQFYISGFANGVTHWDRNTNISFRYPINEKKKDSLPHSSVSRIVFDKNILWVGTRSHGLCKLNISTDKFERVNLIIGDTGILIACMELNNNILWIGTKNHGFFKYDIAKNSAKRFVEKNGLPSDNVLAIIKSDSNTFWLTTTRGLSKFSINSETFKNFTKEEGLQENEFCLNSAFISKDRKIYIGGINGFNVFYPDSISDNQYPPIVTLTKLLINNIEIKPKPNSILTEHISRTGLIVLDNSATVISIEFAAMHFSNPSKNQYKYKLEGIDSDWIETSSDKRYATYTTLPPGQYYFKVKASNNNDVWSNRERWLIIVIKPPYYKTTWFQSLVIFLALLGVTIVVLYRINLVNKRKKELEATNKELFHQKEQIQHQAMMLQNQSLTLQESNENLNNTKDRVVNALNQLRILTEFGQKITSTFDLGTIALMLYNNIRAQMDVYLLAIGIYKYDKDSITYEYFLVNGEFSLPFTRELRSDYSVGSYCFRNDVEVYIPNYSKQWNKYVKNYEVLTAKPPETLFYIPLRVYNKRIGILTIQSTKKDAYTNTNQTTVRALSTYLAIAISNAYSFLNIHHQNEENQASLEYARNLQNAILPQRAYLNSVLDNFLIFKPKHIVSGDFFWCHHEAQTEKIDTAFVAVADCTGHGIPAAFLSMIGSSLLTEIVKMRKIFEPNLILDSLNISIKNILKPDSVHHHEGMDIGLCSITNKGDGTFLIKIASANRFIYLWTKTADEVIRIKGDYITIDGQNTNTIQNSLTLHTYTMYKGDMVYLTTDGFVDQNNPKGLKYTTKKLVEILKQIAVLETSEQKNYLENQLDKHQHTEEQRDDITILGIKL